MFLNTEVETSRAFTCIQLVDCVGLFKLENSCPIVQLGRLDSTGRRRGRRVRVNSLRFLCERLDYVPELVQKVEESCDHARGAG